MNTVRTITLTIIIALLFPVHAMSGNDVMDLSGQQKDLNFNSVYQMLNMPLLAPINTSDSVYIDIFDIIPGESKFIDVWIDSSISFHVCQVGIKLPEGLSFEEISSDEIDSENWSESFVNHDDGLYFLIPKSLADEVSSFSSDNSQSLFYRRRTEDKSYMSFIFFNAFLEEMEIMGDGKRIFFRIKVHASESFRNGTITIGDPSEDWGEFRFFSWQTENLDGYIGVETHTQVTTDNWFPITGLELNEHSANIFSNETIVLETSVTPANATNQVLLWNSDHPDIAHVSPDPADPRKAIVTPKRIGTATITVKSNDGTNLSDSCVITVVPRLVSAITLSETALNLYINTTYELSATLSPNDAYNSAIRWESSQPTIATVSSSGLIQTKQYGTTTITATTTDGSNLSASCDVTVTGVTSLLLNKQNTSIYVGGDETLIATLSPSNTPHSVLSWASNNSSIVTVDQNGNIHGVGPGTATITATTTDGSNLSSSCIVTVTGITSVTLNKEYMSIDLGSSDTLVATITPPDVIVKTLRWSSSNSRVARVTSSGTVYAKSVGTATITATTEDGTNISASCIVDVTGGITSLQLNKDSTAIYIGGFEQLVATIEPSDAFITRLNWTSSNPTVATVNQTGKVTSRSIGTTTITATTTDGTNISASCEVVVKGIDYLYLDKEETTIYIGGFEQLVATIEPSDAIITTLNWASSNPAVATVDQMGKVTSQSIGTTTITATATDGTNISASCEVVVKGIDYLYLDKEETTIYIGGSEQLVATIEPSDVIITTLNWTSSNPAVATVDPTGKITSQSIGTTAITATATDGTNISASCEVVVKGIDYLALDKEEIVIFKGEADTLMATFGPSDVIIKTLTWKSSNSNIVTVDDDGRITAKSAGTATITVSTTDGSNLSASCQVIVLPEYGLSLDKILTHTRGALPETVELSVGMSNKRDISGLQFDLYLPEGVALAYLDDLPDVWLDDARRGRNHSVEVSPTGYGYRILVSSPTNRVFRGHTGNVLHMNVILSQYHPIGNYYIKLSNIVLAEPDETQHRPNSASTEVKLSYLVGDADSDVSVDVADYTITALHILARKPEHFYSDAANVNNDNTINVTDLIGIINIGLGIRPQELRQVKRHDTEHSTEASGTEIQISGHQTERSQLAINLSNALPLAGLQCDLDLPMGTSIEQIEVLGRASRHQLSCNTLPDGTTRLLVSSFSDLDIEPGNDDIILITLGGNTNGAARLINILGVERNLTTHSIDDITIDLDATGVSSVTPIDQARIYVEEGCLVIECPHNGTAQLIDINGIALPLPVVQGWNVFHLDSGFYIVHFEGQTAKIKIQ